MILRIGGVEIDTASKVKEVTQLRAGLDELGVDGAVDGFKWMAELTTDEKFQFTQIVSEYIGDSLIAFFSFGSL